MSPAPQLPGIFHTLAPVLDHYGYLAVGGLVLLEDFGVPVPGETVLIAAAVYAGAGRLNVVAVAVIAFVAAVVGDNIGYAIGHFGGRELALRWGRYVFLTPRRLDHAEDFFRRHGGKIVTVARFVEGLRQANGIIAGIARMRWRNRFVPYETLGAALWVGVWVAVGYTAGNHLDTLYQQIVRYEVYLGVAVAVLFVGYVGYRFWCYRRARRAETDATDSTTTDSTPQPTLHPPSGATMTDSSTQGIKTVLHPVSDLAAAKAVYTALLGVPPSSDAPYYVGFDAAGQHVGLVPGGGPQAMTAPVAYWHVPDIEAKLAEVTAAGAVLRDPVRDVGGGRLVATVTDPDGNVLGLLQDR